MSVNSAVAILDIPLISIRIEIVNKVETFFIVVKCFFLIYPKMVKEN